MAKDCVEILKQRPEFYSFFSPSAPVRAKVRGALTYDSGETSGSDIKSLKTRVTRGDSLTAAEGGYSS